MRTVTVLVDVCGIVARLIGLVLARTVDLGNVDGEVTAQLAIEVGGDVGMAAIDTGVDHTNEDIATSGLLVVRAIRRRIHHLHVPLQVGERLGSFAVAVMTLIVAVAVAVAVRCSQRLSAGATLRFDGLAASGDLSRSGADRGVARHAGDVGLGQDRTLE